MLSRKGFTLLETVISLTIFCSLTLLSIYNLKDYQANMEEHQFLQWFQDSFKSTFNYCYLHKVGGRMVFDRDKVIFHTYDGIKTRNQSKKIPKTLKITHGANSYLINSFGEAEPTTVIVESNLKHRKFFYKIQMSWGEIIETHT